MFIAFLFFPGDHYDLSKKVANGKRFIAYEIIKRLKKTISSGFNAIAGRTFGEQLEKGQHHKVFEESLMRNLFIIANLFRKNNLQNLKPLKR